MVHEAAQACSGIQERFEIILPSTTLSLGPRTPLYAGKRSKHWTTFNEPTVAANCGWALGNHPPGKLLHFKVLEFKS